MFRVLIRTSVFSILAGLPGDVRTQMDVTTVALDLRQEEADIVRRR
jgi:hypothetical protein